MILYFPSESLVSVAGPEADAGAVPEPDDAGCFPVTFTVGAVDDCRAGA